MKNLMRIFSVLFATLVITASVSCKKSEPDNPENDPFSNGGNERNVIVVISDLHLGADLAYAECSENLTALENFLEKVRKAPNVKELIIAGDLLDEWYVPANVNTYQGKDQTDFVGRIATSNKDVVDVFNKIIREKKITVTYVPGNHDLTITSENVNLVFPGINQVRDNEQGIGTYSPPGMPALAIEHGHRYNFFCAPDPYSNQDIAPGTITPPGYFFTRIAALHHVQDCHTPNDTMPELTQNTSGGLSQGLLFIYWNVWKWAIKLLPVENKFDENIIVTNVDGFTGTYSINDLLPYQATAGGEIDVHLFRGIQDTWDQRQAYNHVPVNIPAQQAIANSASADETDNQAKIQYFQNPNSDKRIVVFGHTHDAKIIPSENLQGQKTIYANSGTWIDHNNAGPTTMNFVVIQPQKADAASQTKIKLYNYQGEVFTQMAADSLRL
ncbi:MAG: metallophosphoesterase [Bacteroidales bacterium]|nr:metallophosphoesterase [Bacteroidales bacterium]